MGTEERKIELALSRRSSGATSSYKASSTRNEDGGGMEECRVEFIPFRRSSEATCGTRINSI